VRNFIVKVAKNIGNFYLLVGVIWSRKSTEMEDTQLKLRNAERERERGGKGRTKKGTKSKLLKRKCNNNYIILPPSFNITPFCFFLCP